MRLKGKVAIITGAGSGIGQGVAIKFAKEGASSLLVDISDAGLKETASLVQKAGGKAATMKADVRDRGQLKAIVPKAAQQFGTVDILVNNAGVSKPAFYPDYAVEDIDLILDVNLKAPFILSQHFGRYLVANKKPGRIVNISSINAEKATMMGSTAYCASKGAVRQLTRTAAYDLGPFGITVNAVGPGHTRTGMTRPLFAENAAREREWAEKTPLRRIAEPEDIANAVAFLASDEASYITGQSVYVEGGRCLWA